MTDLDELAAALAEFAQPDKKTSKSSRDERIISGFEEIQRFYDQHGHAPRHGEEHDIFERLYAVRLDRLRAQEDCRTLLASQDTQGLLQDSLGCNNDVQNLDHDAIFAKLEEMSPDGDIRDLKHVRANAEVKAAEEIANRTRCHDFDHFKPLFELVQKEVASGERQSIAFEQHTAINQGDFFILGGVIAYVAEVGDEIFTSDGRQDARLRVIYSVGTESNLLMRSLQKALWKDESGRRLVKPDPGPLFRDSIEEGDQESGVLYVLRSHSSVPFIQEHRSIIHKIGVTGGSIETRISNAKHDATFLLADVEIVATYKLVGINRVKLEKLVHKVFSRAQLDLSIKDRFGNPVKPQEWFMVPLKVIDDAVERIRDGSITKVFYAPESGKLIES